MVDHRSYVGEAHEYDRRGAIQFALLTMFGLREDHYLLDIGCGSFRGGRFFIPYLLPGHYCGVEKHEWLINEGLAKEVGLELQSMKEARVACDDTFDFQRFGHDFDYLLAQAVFCHLPEWQIRQCLEQAVKVWTPGAQLFASFHEGRENYQGEEIAYPAVARYTMAKMEELATEQGLECLRIRADLFDRTGLAEQYRRMQWLRML